MRRETSSEYISKHDRYSANGVAMNGNGKVAVVSDAPAKKEPGLAQLAIAVAGIYGSL
jgi:hypothetical protein